MYLDGRRLHYFLTVADLGSLGRAAQVLHIAQPALSRQIRLLEEDVGVVLMERTTRGMTLTAAHIHEGGPTCACPVKVQTTLASGEVVLTNGSGSFTKANIASPADVAQAMINTPANYYFNVHTPLNGGGVARGVLVKN